MSIRRAYYWCEKCGASETPLDRRLKIEGIRMSPGVRESMCLVGMDETFGNGEHLMKKLADVDVSKETIRRHSEAIGEIVEKQHKAEEEKYDWENRTKEIPQEQLPASKYLYVSADGAKVHLIEKGWTEVRSGVVFDARIQEGKPVRETTTYVGDFEGSHVFMKRLYAESYKRGVDKAEKVVVLGDGAQWIWNESDTHYPSAQNILDYYHGAERIYTIGTLLYGEGEPAVKRFAKSYIECLKKGQIETIISKLKRIKSKSKKTKETIGKAIVYYQNNKDKMRYATYKRKGYFIGSGVVESTCKHLIAERLKGSGMRWRLNNANAILQLRICLLNNQWDTFWSNYNRVA